MKSNVMLLGNTVDWLGWLADALQKKIFILILLAVFYCCSWLATSRLNNLLAYLVFYFFTLLASI